jgi:hypothetical protein
VDFMVGISSVPNAGMGLFCMRDLPRFTAFLYEGEFSYLGANSEDDGHLEKVDAQYSLAWPEYHPYGIIGNFRPKSDSFAAAQINEPCSQEFMSENGRAMTANCVYESSIYGLYVVLTRDMKRFEELLVYYGSLYPADDYVRPEINMSTDESRELSEVLNLFSTEPLL